MIALALFEDKGRLWRGSAVRGKVDFMAVNDMWTSNLHFSSHHFVPFHNSSFVSYLNINASANDSSLSGNRVSHTYGDLLFQTEKLLLFLDSCLLCTTCASVKNNWERTYCKGLIRTHVVFITYWWIWSVLTTEYVLEYFLLKQYVLYLCRAIFGLCWVSAGTKVCTKKSGVLTKRWTAYQAVGPHSNCDHVLLTAV